MNVRQIGAPPEHSKWTQDQWTAIEASGTNILVAAAAGSGKTAVLVERIIRKITSDIDVDRLLVATFTKAAAAEMKERITIALEDQLAAHPSSQHLQKQLVLINRASITTLHSFCLDVIRRYYPLIDLDPGFRIANEAESELLRLEVLELLLEYYYDNDESAPLFLQLVDYFGGEKSDDLLSQLILRLYNFAHSHPWPVEWLREAAAAYQLHDEQQLEQSMWAIELQAAIQLQLEGAIGLLQQAISLTNDTVGAEVYLETLTAEWAQINHIHQLLQEQSWLKMSSHFDQLVFDRLKPVRDKNIDKQQQERIKELRESAKKQVLAIKDEWFNRPLEQMYAEIQSLAPLMEQLSAVVIAFTENYELAKRQRGLVDFVDLEHYCLRILRDPASTASKSLPSTAALEYQAQFVEILLDEYQDINLVQESIIDLIATVAPGNRFMVGDVKQSIYRFRLAEPNLFLHKYKTYEPVNEVSDGLPGIRIDLARNFRSRKQVVNGVNQVFRALMKERVAEMDYSQEAELIYGASYPEMQNNYGIELVILQKENNQPSAQAGESEQNDGEHGETSSAAQAEMQTAQIEACYIAKQMKELMENRFLVYDARRQEHRPLEWRDCVILLRATANWAPLMMEELQNAGIPAYAELNSGYFSAVEVETIMSLLRIIDNPYQDIPLAAVLRSPIFSFHAEQLAQIRISVKQVPYYDALLHAAGDMLVEESLRLKITRFLDQLDQWRIAARDGSLSKLLWSIFEQTGYYDFVGGLIGGVQRQANLKLLYDRARQYEATAVQGLYSFLRFIDKMQATGSDLGVASAQGESENVVKIMSIHKSKGLEFPVVFVAGLNKMFNQQDIRSPFLLHKRQGLGPKVVDMELAVSYPSLPYMSIKAIQQKEALAEELRILYVALTRPKEKLFLVATVSGVEKKLQQWQEKITTKKELSNFSIAAAQHYMDWLGPLTAALFPLEDERTEAPEQAEWSVEGTAGKALVYGWRCQVISALQFTGEHDENSKTGVETTEKQDRLFMLTEQIPINMADHGEGQLLAQRLEWQYPHVERTKIAAKASVTELKRAGEPELTDTLSYEQWMGNGERTKAALENTLVLRRPAFMAEQKLSPAEIGTAYHTFMQHVDFTQGDDPTRLEQQLQYMITNRLLTAKHASHIALATIAQFINSDLGQRLKRANWLQREVPFSYMLPANRAYPKVPYADDREERVLVQGIIDCLFEDDGRIVLIDFKTDRIANNQLEDVVERHRFQMELYAEAIAAIMGQPLAEMHLFFFDGAHSIRLK
ncbi:helicase-exonuclease AddAB subunit AddA [Paenibacillus yanchengensis]|uniref:ATP-dependent helicase/nuclease subunit A n=1 Tax=Paenibacillus yanchengensis TaxID=2035833 RepID=A0ABW4YKN6_9BACL